MAAATDKQQKELLQKMPIVTDEGNATLAAIAVLTKHASQSLFLHLPGVLVSCLIQTTDNYDHVLL